MGERRHEKICQTVYPDISSFFGWCNKWAKEGVLKSYIRPTNHFHPVHIACGFRFSAVWGVKNSEFLHVPGCHRSYSAAQVS